MHIKRDKIDAVFSQLVRERAVWTCERCGKYFPLGQRQALHASHFFSRRSRALRWHGLNAAAHCFSCHLYLEGNPLIFSAWVEDHIGPQSAAYLLRAANSVVKFTKSELEEIYRHLKDELERLRALRDSGEIGRLEFETPKIILARLKETP